MGSISVDMPVDTRKPYYDYLGLLVKDYGEQKLEEKTVEIEQRETMKMASGSSMSTTMYVVMGVGAVLVLTLAVLKKKGVI